MTNSGFVGSWADIAQHEHHEKQRPKKKKGQKTKLDPQDTPSPQTPSNLPKPEERPDSNISIVSSPEDKPTETVEILLNQGIRRT